MMTALRLTKNDSKTQKIKENHITQSFNVPIILRILNSLSNHDSLNTTGLAMLSSMNYSRCKQYLNLMSELNWIVFEKDNDKKLKIKCTQNGKKAKQELEQFLEKSKSQNTR